jgi:hypothetical protein
MAAPLGASPVEALEAVAAPLAELPIEAIAADPNRFVGQRVLCRSHGAALPVDWRPEQSGLLGVLARSTTPLGRHRVALTCEAADLAVIAVHAYFPARQQARPPAIDAGATLLLTVLGASPSGTLMARCDRVVRARDELRAAAAAGPVPDLASVLWAPERALSAELACFADGPVDLVAEADLLADERAGLWRARGGAEGAASTPVGAIAALRCHQAVGPPVPTLLAAEPGSEDLLLAIREGTVLRVRVGGAARNRILAAALELVSGAAPARPDDLRRLLARPQEAAGAALRCVSMGVPLPRPGADDDEALSDRRAWLVCRQQAAPPVSLTLRVRRGEEEALLAITRGTRLRARVRAAQPPQIEAVLEEIEQGAAPAAARAGDLRRFLALDARLRGSALRCQVSAVEDAALRGEDRPGARLFGPDAALAPRPVRLRCADSLRPAGQPFEVYFRSTRARERAGVAAGQALRLRFVGLAEGTPVARFLGPATAADDAVAGGDAAPGLAAVPGLATAPRAGAAPGSARSWQAR